MANEFYVYTGVALVFGIALIVFGAVILSRNKCDTAATAACQTSTKAFRGIGITMIVLGCIVAALAALMIGVTLYGEHLDRLDRLDMGLNDVGCNADFPIRGRLYDNIIVEDAYRGDLCAKASGISGSEWKRYRPRSEIFSAGVKAKETATAASL